MFIFFVIRFNGFHSFCVKNLCTKYCCKSLNKQSSGVQERINSFYINTFGQNSFGLRKFRFTNDLQERIKFVNRGLTVLWYVEYSSLLRASDEPVRALSTELETQGSDSEVLEGPYFQVLGFPWYLEFINHISPTVFDIKWTEQIEATNGTQLYPILWTMKHSCYTKYSYAVSRKYLTLWSLTTPIGVVPHR